MRRQRIVIEDREVPCGRENVLTGIQSSNLNTVRFGTGWRTVISSGVGAGARHAYLAKAARSSACGGSIVAQYVEVKRRTAEGSDNVRGPVNIGWHGGVYAGL